MDANDRSHGLLSKHQPDAKANPITAAGRAKTASRGRLRCDEVARNRAARYARKRSIPKLLWPLIAAMILVGLLLERRPLPVLPWARGRPLMDDEGNTPVPRRDERPGVDGLPDPGDMRGMIDGELEPRYRPPIGFLYKDAAQVVAFLIRNRGQLDNEAVRAKWSILDRISLALAVYLREVEANAAWDDLEKEISDAAPAAPFEPSAGIPGSVRHRKILRLLPEWSRRGEEIMPPESPDDPKSASTFDVDSDDRPDTKPPKP